MDAKEVDTRMKALQKAVAEKQPAATIITMLETLKKDVVPTEELLRVCSCAFFRVATGRLHSGYLRL